MAELEAHVLSLEKQQANTTETFHRKEEEIEELKKDIFRRKGGKSFLVLYWCSFTDGSPYSSAFKGQRGSGNARETNCSRSQRIAGCPWVDDRGCSKYAWLSFRIRLLANLFPLLHIHRGHAALPVYTH